MMSPGLASTVISAVGGDREGGPDVGDQPFEIVRGENGRGSAADVERIEMRSSPGTRVHFPAEGRQKSGDQRPVGDGVETAVGAFPEAEGDVDVEARQTAGAGIDPSWPAASVTPYPTSGRRGRRSAGC